MAKAKTARAPAKSASAIAREALKRKSLDGWRSQGTGVGAGRAAGVRESTVRGWFRDDPEYREAVALAIDEYAATAGQETHNALLEHVRAAARGDYVVTKRGVESGKEVRLEERVALNPALARLLLTRADPRFTHPDKDRLAKVEDTLESLLKASAEREKEAKGDA